MAVYKIPQDVEADDKFVGPLSFKQFIFCGIAGIAGYLSFLAVTKGLWLALIVFIPIIIVTGFLGFPWGRDQPTEIWLAARIRFFLKPRTRIWNQAGIKELVTITVPKKIERHLTDGLSQNEVKSRLSGLADLLDSRGWAVKNVNVNLYGNPSAPSYDSSEDRLVNVASLPQEVVEVSATDDVLDEQNNPTAQHLDQMIKSSEEKHRQDVMNQLTAARQAPQQPADDIDTPKAPNASADFWFLQKGAHNGEHQTGDKIKEQLAPKQPYVEQNLTTFRTPDIVAPHAASAPIPATEETVASRQVSAEAEAALLEKVHKNHDSSVNPFGHIKTIQPLGHSAPQPDPSITQALPASVQTSADPTSAQPPTPPVTPPVNPAIMSLANNDDLNVATLARQANKQDKQPPDNEVVVSLR